MKKLFIPILILIVFFAEAQTGKRKIRPGDVYRLQTISDPQVSPEGSWISYVLTSTDSAKDKRNSDVWMVSWNGQQSIQLTSSPDGESSPRWSPDGKFLSFVSSRQGKKSQIWLMDRRGGEGKKITDLKNDVYDYRWSPDSKRLLITINDAPDTSKTKTTSPIVIDRYQFKQDVQGYWMKKYTHLYLYDVATKKLDTLTSGPYNHTAAAWSPDGNQIAFESNRTADPDKNENTDIWIIEAKKGSTPRQITTWKGYDSDPKWSPDGKQIAYLRSSVQDNFIMYDQAVLSVVPKEGGEPVLLTKALDRPVHNHMWSKDGKHISIVVTDDRQRYIARVDSKTGLLTKVAAGNRAYYTLDKTPNEDLISMMSEPQLPGEIYAVENGTPRRLTKHQDDFVAPLLLASVEGFTSKSKDGTTVSNLLFRPANAPVNQKLPTIFYIHGGPVAQDEYGFDLSRQMLAADGYAVVGVNYRGSSGRGLAYTKAIYADWGNKEVVDIHGAVDYLVREGIADPDRLGMSGWSYGGMLTDYCIATDTRFKAAVSGAGSALQLSVYGSDQYVLQYENELGVPWKNLDKYLKLSYAFLKADKIKTPTLFMVGEKDFNVPAIGSEQMYQALKSQDIPTGLVIYPGQFHGITTPSYQVDRFDRYKGWFDRHLKGITPVKISKEIH